MRITNLRDFAATKGIRLAEPERIASEVEEHVQNRYRHTAEEMKARFDALLQEIHDEIYAVYLRYEAEYGEAVLNALIEDLIQSGELTGLQQVGLVLGRHFMALDRFFLSLGQGRRARAGRAFESIHNALFKRLGYPFSEQQVINGKPDFVLPSIEHYRRNAMDCIIFTTKRTVRERWRQIISEGTRGLGFYLATLDEDVSSAQLQEMLRNRIYLVCPERIKEGRYPTAQNVLSFREFFEHHLDPAMNRWRHRGII